MRETKSPVSKSPTSLLILVAIAVALFASACDTAPQSSSNTVLSKLAQPTAEPGSAININTASSQELEKLPGVGNVIAERIVAHREQYGPFRRAEHLLMVRGISDKKFRQLRTLIAVE